MRRPEDRLEEARAARQEYYERCRRLNEAAVVRFEHITRARLEQSRISLAQKREQHIPFRMLDQR